MCGKLLIQDFLSPEVLRGIDIPVMNEAAVEDFESLNYDERTVSSTTTSASEELLVHVLATDVIVWLCQTNITSCTL